jgi:sarcosine oxidase
MTQYDVAVVGLGAMGAHAVQQLAARGVRVIGIERFGPLHDRGSSHGDTRLIRLGYFEGAGYVPLLQRAYRNWRKLEERSGADIMTVTGVLQIGKPDDPVVSGTLSSCKQQRLAYDILDAEGMRQRFPAFALDEDEVAVYEPRGGFLRPETAVLTALRLAATDGVELHFGERVTRIDGGKITTTSGTYEAETVIVAAGTYVNELVPELRGIAVPIRQVVGWFLPKNQLVTKLGRMPVFLRGEGKDNSYFGFPAIDAMGVKIGKHCHFSEEIDPEQDNPPVNDRDRKLLSDFMEKRLPAAAGPATGFITCRYMMLPGEDFLIDRLPSNDNMIVASPCSGHGFKFASVIGEILADLTLDGGTDLNIGGFSFAALQDRIATKKPGG